MLAPVPRGSVSSLLLGWLVEGRSPDLEDAQRTLTTRDAGCPAGYDEDLQLALWVLYELHYGGFDDVDESWEWSPEALWVRRQLEEVFEGWLRAQTRDLAASVTSSRASVADALFALAADAPGPSLTAYLQRRATRPEMLEFLTHRTVYHLKEADPHTWALPRLRGRAKVALAEVQYDEYGGGRPERLHAAMFADTLIACGLDPDYGAYLEHVPAITLATNNAMSLFGLHRRLRGAAVGHLAAFEATSSLPARRVARGLRRLGFPPLAAAYFDEHVEADAVHEQVVAREICEPLVADDPTLLVDVAFGAASCLQLDALCAEFLLERWARGDSSLRAQGDLVELSGG